MENKDSHYLSALYDVDSDDCICLNCWLSDTADSRTIIELDVGGVHFRTTKSTLLSEPDSDLYHMLFDNSGKCTLPRTKQGLFFIDRDGATFAHVLRWLRTGKLYLHLSDQERADLLEEARYFALARLAKALLSL